jgi:hypothetical protein
MGKRIVLSLSLFFLFCAAAEAGKWVSLGSDTDNNDHYYNDAMTYYPKGIVGVWLKTVWSEQGKSRLADDVTQKGMGAAHSKNLHHTTGLYKINCNTRERTACSGTIYDKKGKIISDFKFPERWIPTDRDSLMDAAYTVACSNKRIK